MHIIKNHNDNKEMIRPSYSEPKYLEKTHVDKGQTYKPDTESKFAPANILSWLDNIVAALTNQKPPRLHYLRGFYCTFTFYLIIIWTKDETPANGTLSKSCLCVSLPDKASNPQICYSNWTFLGRVSCVAQT